MKGVQQLAAKVTSARRPVSADNPFLAAQAKVSDQIIAALDSYRTARDQQVEQTFFSFYGSPVVQAMLGITTATEVRPAPPPVATPQGQAELYAAKLIAGGFDDALTRALLYLFAADRALDQRCALALNARRQQLMRYSLAEVKARVRNQFYALKLGRERAVDALASMVPEPKERRELVRQLDEILAAAGPPSAAERERLARLSQVLAIPAVRSARVKVPA